MFSLVKFKFIVECVIQRDFCLHSSKMLSGLGSFPFEISTVCMIVDTL